MSADSQEKEEDRAEITRVITQYVEGFLHANGGALRGAFAADAVMKGYMGDRLVEGTPDVFIENVAKSAPIASGSPDARYEIGEIDITGHVAAVAVTEYSFGGSNFTDYMHLLKRDGHWKIVSKTFSTF